MIYTFGDEMHAARDDIPLLSQWIKKRLAKQVVFLVGHQGLEPKRTDYLFLSLRLLPCTLIADKLRGVLRRFVFSTKQKAPNWVPFVLVGHQGLEPRTDRL